jgi:DNA-binding transcriptional MocR family regulator
MTKPGYSAASLRSGLDPPAGWSNPREQKRLPISSLAEELGRIRGTVTRDVNKLRKFGLLRLREQVNPGHGIVQIVEPVAKKIEMRAAI